MSGYRDISDSSFDPSASRNDESNSNLGIMEKAMPTIMASAKQRGHRHVYNTDTSSDASDHGGMYEVIEYDLHDKQATNINYASATATASTSPFFAELEALHIQDDSPAAAALRANANVRVSRTGKAARAVHMQTVRKIVKRATGATKSGVTRGKPPRLPPTIHEGGVVQQQQPAHVDHTSDGQYLEAIDETTEDRRDDPRDLLERQDSHIPDGVVAGTAEAGNKVLDQVDTHDLLKLLRWRRKGKADSFKKVQKSYVKGKVIDGEHELYTLSIAVMIGVRTSISRTNTQLNSGPGRRWIRSMDFKAVEKYEFRPKGDAMTPPHMLAHTFKFKDYAPVIFAYLRRMCGVNEFDFLLSVCGNANFIEFISNAKSGQFFFYSNDGRYMIKTMTNAESKFLRRILPDYFRHCAENPNTTITRFFGMYRVKLYHLRRNVKFVIMSSVYYTDKFLQNFYDLKGSVAGRDAKPGDAVKKDNDLRRGLPGEALALEPEQRMLLRAQLVSDCKFLTEMGVMDYSMLVGVHHIPVKEQGKDSPIVGFRGARPRLNSAPTGSESEPTTAGVDITPAVKNGPHAHCLSETIGAFFYENGLEDDDSSYLDGVNEEDRPFNEVTERKKQATIENLYWPFHRYFDIHGHRLLKPATAMTPGSSSDEEDILKRYNIPRFVPPISKRKDGGLEMNTIGQRMPMKYHGPNGYLLCDGKIFFMGIIDILQEYSSRKVLESTYRAFTSDRSQASCVAPVDYGSRFIRFFDEYTQPLPYILEGEDEPDKKKTVDSNKKKKKAGTRKHLQLAPSISF